MRDLYSNIHIACCSAYDSLTVCVQSSSRGPDPGIATRSSFDFYLTLSIVGLHLPSKASITHPMDHIRGLTIEGIILTIANLSLQRQRLMNRSRDDQKTGTGLISQSLMRRERCEDPSTDHRDYLSISRTHLPNLGAR